MKMLTKFWSLTAFLITIVGLPMISNVNAATHLIHDDFKGKLDQHWQIKQLDAYTQDGWAVLNNPGGYPYRDAFIIRGEGCSWSDYHLKTHFFAEGPTYVAEVLFRVQDFNPWTTGTFYRLEVFTPLTGGDYTNRISLLKVVNNVYYTLIDSYSQEGVVNEQDNLLDIKVIGGRIRAWVNGTKIVDYTDPHPIRTGGIGLGSLWEDTTRYDYLYLDAVTHKPTHKYQCKNGGWKDYGFNNEGQCIKYLNTGK
jgi:hypothetical protein